MVKNNHIEAKILKKNALNQTGNDFNTKLRRQRKDGKNSYEVRQYFSFFYNLIVVYLGYNSLKNLRVTKSANETTFEGASDELEWKDGF